MPLPYNVAMLGRIGGEIPIVLASPVSAMAYPMPALEALALKVLVEAAPDARKRWISELVSRSVLRIRVGERTIEDPAEQETAITDAVDALLGGKLAKLVELGIVTPT